MVDAELRAALDAVEAHWNDAEQHVKQVERLRRGQVVGASINEFRYAGRRLVDAYAMIKVAEKHPERRTDALVYLSEAKHFCLRARHDASDAAVMYIDQALDELEKTFGADLLHDKFPQYLRMKKTIRDIGQIMATSRGERDERIALYGDIENGAIATLIEDHYEIESSEVILTAAFTRRIRGEKRDTVRFYLTIFLATIAAVAAILALPPFVRYLSNDHPAASIPSTHATPGGPKPPP